MGSKQWAVTVFDKNDHLVDVFYFESENEALEFYENNKDVEYSCENGVGTLQEPEEYEVD